jgi:dimethylamine/trimethylamine dehydrogenase
VQERLMSLGVRITPQHSVTAQGPDHARLTCLTPGQGHDIPCQTLVLVTGRLPVDDLWQAMEGRPNLARVGDCLAPSSIADAVYSAHRFARLLGEPDLPPRRERPAVRNV